MNQRNILILIGVIIIAVFGYGLVTRSAESPLTEDTEFVDEEISTVPDTGITTDDILNQPETYEGSVVELRAEVEDWLGPSAFTLDAPGIIDDNLLVITQDPTTVFEDPEIFGDAIWEVNGTVDRFVFAETIDTYDLDLQPDAFAIYEGAPYVLAESVTLYED